MINITATPCHENFEYRLRSIQSSRCQYPYLSSVSWFFDSARYSSGPDRTFLMPTMTGLCGSSAVSTPGMDASGGSLSTPWSPYQ